MNYRHLAANLLRYAANLLDPHPPIIIEFHTGPHPSEAEVLREIAEIAANQ